MQEKTLLKQKNRTSNIHSMDFGSVSYDIFGSPYQKTGSFLADDSLDFGYLEKPYNADTELYDYGFRDYSPTIARFTSVDPIRDGRNWYSYVVNDPVNYVDLWGLECKSESDGNQKIVIFSALDLSDSLNNIGYNLLVSDSGKKIKKAAEEMGFQFELINGDDATQEKFNILQKDSTITRLVIIAYGQQRTGNAYSVDDLPLKITIDNEIPVIDIVACYASSNPNYKSNSTTIVNTYNPGTSTSYISDDDEIWHNQTNEVLKETIPNAILNNISNSSKEPTQKPNKITKFLMEMLF